MSATLALPEAPRILLLRLSHLGDVVCGLPALRLLCAARPKAKIAWVVQREFAELLRGEAALDAVIPFDRQGGLRALVAVRAAMRSFRPQLTIDLQGNLKSVLLARLAGAPSFGPSLRDGQEPIARLLHTRRATPAPAPHPLPRAVHQVGQALGLGLKEIPLRRGLELLASEQAEGEGCLAELLPERGRPRRIVQPGRAGDPRSLPLEKLLPLIEGLAQFEDILVLSGPMEADLGRALEAALGSRPGLRHLVDQRGLRALAAIFAAAARQSIRLLTGDSGPAHLAAAMGAFVDVWIGPTIPQRTGPWPPANEGNSPHRALCAPDQDLSRIDPARWVEELRQGQPIR